MSQPSDLPESLDTTPRYGTGFLVVALYIFFVLAVFAGFASYLTRSDLEAHLGNGDSNIRSLDELIYLLKREEQLEELLAVAVRQVREADEAIDLAKQEILIIEAEESLQLENLDRLAVQTLQHVEGGMTLWTDASQARMFRALDRDENRDDVDRVRAVLAVAPVLEFDPEGEAARVAALRVALDEAASDLAALDEVLAQITVQRAGFQANLERALEGRSWPKRQQEKHEKERVQLSTLKQEDTGIRARILALARLYGGTLFLELVSMPTIFLTLIVTMAAGGLGTVVSYTRGLQSRERLEARAEGRLLVSDDVSRLMVMVGEGIAAALAIFLLAGAGMLVLTQGSGPNNQIELSPYTVAFIAFLSGFMAENAFTRIQEAGRKLFSVEKEDKRDGVCRYRSDANGNASTASDPDPDSST